MKTKIILMCIILMLIGTIAFGEKNSSFLLGGVIHTPKDSGLFYAGFDVGLTFKIQDEIWIKGLYEMTWLMGDGESMRHEFSAGPEIIFYQPDSMFSAGGGGGISFRRSRQDDSCLAIYGELFGQISVGDNEVFVIQPFIRLTIPVTGIGSDFSNLSVGILFPLRFF